MSKRRKRGTPSTAPKAENQELDVHKLDLEEHNACSMPDIPTAGRFAQAHERYLAKVEARRAAARARRPHDPNRHLLD